MSRTVKKTTRQAAKKAAAKKAAVKKSVTARKPSKKVTAGAAAQAAAKASPPRRKKTAPAAKKRPPAGELRKSIPAAEREKRDTGEGGDVARGAAKRHRYDPERKKRSPVWVKRRTLDYEDELKELQIELLKLQNHVKASGEQVVMLFEGRDAAGKGGTIKRIADPLNPRGARVVALEKPSDRERTQWYFQRYVTHLPAAGEIVLFDRSWYNRAMVEPVMGFCSDEEHKRFMKDVPLFEEMLVKSGVRLFKFYFSVSKNEQLRRFVSRQTDPLKQYKISPVDQHAQRLWDVYTVKKFQMLTETNRTVCPWWIIRSDDKKNARLNVMRLILSQLQYEGKRVDLFAPDPAVVVSGIDELKMMEDNILSDGPLPG